MNNAVLTKVRHLVNYDVSCVKKIVFDFQQHRTIHKLRHSFKGINLDGIFCKDYSDANKQAVDSEKQERKCK